MNGNFWLETLNLWFPLGLLVVGYGFGRWQEWQHLS